MPYKIEKQNGKECVVKEGGEVKHCYSGGSAHSQALAYMRALYQAEGEKKEVEAIDKELAEMGLDTKEIEDLTAKCMSSYVPWGVKSFEELDAWKEAQEIAIEVGQNTLAFGSLVQNIMADPEWGMNEKVSAVKELADEFAGRMSDTGMEGKEVAITDSDTSITEGDSEDFVELLDEPEGEEKAKRADVTEADKKRAVAEYGKVTFADPTNKKYPLDSEKHIRAAWSYINMPKNAAKYPDKGASIKRKIVAAWKRKIDKNGPPQAAKKELDGIVETVLARVKELFGLVPKEQPGFMVYKESDGSTRWIARYSNHYRDQDNPPEIISSQSHQSFADKVEKGLAPLPDLWIWHVKEWRIGKADWVTYDPDSGFAVAGGHSLPGMEPAFDQLASVKALKVSHGMPKHSIKRDQDDPTIIIEHETREISPLPGWAAANKLTGFVVLDPENKEANMAIPADKRETLIKEFGFSEELLAKIEAANAVDANKAKDEGLEHKETETPAEPPAAEPVQAEPAPEPVAQPVAETPAAEPDATAKAITELTAVVKALAEKVSALETKQVEEQKAKVDAVQTALSQTPVASILSMFEQKSAIGADETAVDGRTSLAKSKPAEAKPAVEGRTLVPFINELLAGTKPAGQQQ